MSDGLIAQLRAEAELAADQALAKTKAGAKRGAVRAGFALAALAFGAITLGFLTFAAYLALAVRFAPVEAGLAIAGAYAALALVCGALAMRANPLSADDDEESAEDAPAPPPIEQARATLHAVAEEVSARAGPRSAGLLREGARRLPAMSAGQMALLAVAVGFVYARVTGRSD